MRKIITSIGLLLSGSFVYAQGLDSIIVEKYYVSNAADATASVGTLPAGSVTYRVFVDLKAGYEFQAIYGEQDAQNNPLHTLLISTSTSFFNNEDRGATTANAVASAQLKNNTVALDSWFSVGGAATGQMGVLKSEDDGAANLIAANSVLKNAPASIGIPLTTQDGIMAGTPQAVTFVGFSTETDVFDATSQFGNSFSTSNGSVASLNGSVGPTSTNRVLIGQFTTDGVFHFELNIQIRSNPGGVVEKYVSSNPVNGELTHTSLTYTSLVATPNSLPTTSITAPTSGSSITTGSTFTVSATAADTDGTIDSVVFYMDGNKIGKDVSAPYSQTLTSTVGTHTLTVVATDNSGGQTTSTAVTYTGSAIANNGPSVNITQPAASATFSLGDVVSIKATATDTDGTIDSVVFFANGVRLGKDVSAPYTFTLAATVGTHTLTATATDNKGAQATSAAIVITVKDTTIGINEVAELASNTLVYPNPAKDNVTLQINSTKGYIENVHYNLYDILGIKVLGKNTGTVTAPYIQSINISNLSAGQYLLEINADNQQTFKKIIKQ